MILLIRVIIFIVSAAGGFFAMYLAGFTINDKGGALAFGFLAVVGFSIFLACVPAEYIKGALKWLN